MHWISMCVCAGRIQQHPPTLPDGFTTSYSTAKRVAEHSAMCCATFMHRCYQVSSDISLTPMAHIHLWPCFMWISRDTASDMYRVSLWALPLASWSLVACIMSTSFVIKLWKSVGCLRVYFTQEYIIHFIKGRFVHNNRVHSLKREQVKMWLGFFKHEYLA